MNPYVCEQTDHIVIPTSAFLTTNLKVEPSPLFDGDVQNSSMRDDAGFGMTDFLVHWSLPFFPNKQSVGLVFLLGRVFLSSHLGRLTCRRHMGVHVRRRQTLLSSSVSIP